MNGAHTELAEFREDWKNHWGLKQMSAERKCARRSWQGARGQKLAGSGAVTRNIMRKLAVTIPRARKKENAELKGSERIWNSIASPFATRLLSVENVSRNGSRARSTYFVKQCNLIRARGKSLRIESPFLIRYIIQVSCVKLYSYSSKSWRQKSVWGTEREKESERFSLTGKS